MEQPKKKKNFCKALPKLQESINVGPKGITRKIRTSDTVYREYYTKRH